MSVRPSLIDPRWFRVDVVRVVRSRYDGVTIEQIATEVAVTEAGPCSVAQRVAKIDGRPRVRGESRYA